jgi:hypothetical protein
MKNMFTRFFAGKKQSIPALEERIQNGPIKPEWIFVDKGNYLMCSLPFSL